MSRPGYTEEFKIEAVKQVVERGHRVVAEVAERLGASGHSLYHWIKRYDKPVEQRQEDDDLQAETSAWTSTPSSWTTATRRRKASRGPTRRSMATPRSPPIWATKGGAWVWNCGLASSTP